MEEKFKIKLTQINQNEFKFYSGKIKFKDLIKIRKLSERKEESFDFIKEEERKDQSFQRVLNKGKLKKIEKYMKILFEEEGSYLNNFPTNILLGLNGNPKDMKFEKYLKFEKNKKDEEYFLSIFEEKELFLIIDGQHRLEGLNQYYKKLINNEIKKKVEDFEFSINIIFAEEIHTLAKIFVDVNFTQKPVNRSLYYDIFGSIPELDSEIEFIHKLAIYLNSSKDSVIRGFINQLGTGKGYFSQAFIVGKLLKYNKTIWEKYYESFCDLKDDKKEYKKIAIFMKKYFQGIKEVYSKYFPTENLEYKYILFKTNGIGAFCRLIKDIFPKVEKYLDNEEELLNNIKDYLGNVSDEKQKEFFENSEGSSESAQLKLYLKLKKEMNFELNQKENEFLIKKN